MRLTLTPLGLIVAVLPTLNNGFMYRPDAGVLWDPSCLVYEGTTYCYYMCVEPPLTPLPFVLVHSYF